MTNSPKNSGRLLTIVIVLLLVGAGVWFALTRNKAVDPRLLGRVERQDLIQRITVAGSIVGRRSSYVQPTYASYVGKLFVKLGDKVRPGQPLVSLSQNPGDTAGAFPLRAPFGGTIVQVLVSEGDYVEASTAPDKSMMRIDDLSQIYLQADTPELEYPKIVLGQEVIIKASAILERTYKGQVVEKFLASKQTDRWEKSRVEYPVRIRITDPDDRLRPGMSAIVDIVAFRKNKVLALRQEYVQNEGDRYFVITRLGEKKYVTVGVQNDEFFEITGGLKEGDEVKQVDFLSLGDAGG